jgi:glucan phosphorylase
MIAIEHILLGASVLLVLSIVASRLSGKAHPRDEARKEIIRRILMQGYVLKAYY